MPLFYFRHVQMSNSDFEEVYTNLKSSSFKGALITTLSGIATVNEKNENNFTFKICKESFVTLPNVMYFRKNFFLVDSINEVVMYLQSSGLIEYWHFNNIGRKLFNTKTDGDGEPRIMTVDDLIGCFQLWGCGCIISMTACVVERFVILKIRTIFYRNPIDREVSV